ncbi:DNA (cytosine-5-)-methyltransferase [Bacillus cereus]|nr:DNA (cytosine-5-)-methyltransferase [Bacillus cereus]PEQ99032.1 DNA (cytosine-5-)-methyltransferase [Bacillus cereus]PFC05078.1 DNA (cytosine-5-)-methyltransferase [Bacillus cereus]PFF10719.1 DNA (cytosine-5-)-methyltransferase [Bacillus cereus]PFK21653.1 DNA (cytosine-5-)-methyltransferase [Bacillus cereus]PGK12412.1 DNA (cytosine-5-)-methyltransferase [Bacillus cereus]
MRKLGITTQKELAEKLNITQNQLSMLLSSNFNPIKSNAMKLCETLEVDLEEIMDFEQMALGLEDALPEITEEANSNTPLIPTDYEGRDFIEVRNIKSNNRFTGIELFAGAGGLALGLEEAGFHSIGLVEIDKHACKTLRKNRPNWNVIERDIVEVAEKGIKNFMDKPPAVGELDLLSGGYPCQTFSYAGKKMGLDDVRGTMFYYYAKILDDLKPKTFLAENVKGLVNHDNGKTLATMLSVFKDIGYDVQWKVLRALDYDVAQKRERIVIIGIRSDLAEKYDLSYSFPKPYGYELTIGDILKDTPISEGAKYPESKREVLDLVPPGGYWRDLPDEIAKTYMGKSYYSGGGRTGMARRLSWDEPSLTLTCSPAQKQTERCHPEETRPFTVREYARIQSFPDNWEFDCSMNNAYKQIGNAVPVNMARAVGLSIVDILKKIK